VEDLTEHCRSKDHKTRKMELIFQQEDENRASQEDGAAVQQPPGSSESQSQDPDSDADDEMDES